MQTLKQANAGMLKSWVGMQPHDAPEAPTEDGACRAGTPQALFSPQAGQAPGGGRARGAGAHSEHQGALPHPCRVPQGLTSQSCLISMLQGGGHAFIGLHLAKALLKKGHSVTIFNDGDQVGGRPAPAELPALVLLAALHGSVLRGSDRQRPQAKLSKKGPYSQYAGLESEGVRVVFGNPEDRAALPTDKFDVIYDNNAKKLEVNQGLIDLAKVLARARQPARRRLLCCQQR